MSAEFTDKTFGQPHHGHDERDGLSALPAAELSLVSKLVKETDEVAEKIAALELELKARKADHERLTTQRLPEAMAELGLQKLTLSDGAEVGVKQEYHCSIPKARKDEAMEWLRENDCGDIIKTFVAVEFGKGEDSAALTLALELRKKFDDRPVGCEHSVHASTLKALVKERFESGNPMPEELFGIFQTPRATIKR